MFAQRRILRELEKMKHKLQMKRKRGRERLLWQ